MDINLPIAQMRSMGNGIVITEGAEHLIYDNCMVIEFSDREELAKAVSEGACCISFFDDTDIPLSPECQDTEAA